METHFRHLVDHCTDLVLRFTRDGQLLSANPACRRALDLTPVEVSRRRLLDLIPARDHEHFRLAFAAAAGGEPAVPVHLTLQNSGGAEFAVEGVLSGRPGTRAEDGRWAVRADPWDSLWAILHTLHADARAGVGASDEVRIRRMIMTTHAEKASP